MTRAVTEAARHIVESRTMDERHSPFLIEDSPSHSTERRGEEPARPPTRWPWVLVAVLIVLGAGYYYFLRPKPTATQTGGASPGGRPGRGALVTPVDAARVQKGDIGVYLTGLGTVVPINTVTVKSRVDGQLMRVLFKEGDLVHQGELLAEIDSRPFEVQLHQAEGTLLKDQALLDNARLDLARYQTLVKQNAVPEQQLATQKATVAEDEGIVKTDQALIDSAKLNIIYCHITAPITGRIGLRQVDPGNIVHASDSTGLLVITQIQPISVIFTIAEDQVPAVLKKMRSGQRLNVDAYNRDMKTRIAQGWLTTVDNQIDQTTGTLRLRATFNNADNALFPNQFVNARLLLEEKKGVTLAPAAAIQRNSLMTYAYVIKPDSTVTVRQVAVGTTEGDQSEITSGLSPGDMVVMTGVDKLQEGSKVSTHSAGDHPPRQN
ncbi:MAG: MdtA/MuxA family multidrug efflux RND transporter periplasmic adaptor subunit [Terriglobia bacterium]